MPPRHASIAADRLGCAVAAPSNAVPRSSSDLHAERDAFDPGVADTLKTAGFVRGRLGPRSGDLVRPYATGQRLATRSTRRDCPCAINDVPPPRDRRDDPLFLFDSV